MRYEPIPDDERPGTGLVCNLCRVSVEVRPCPVHAALHGTDPDRYALLGVCGQCGRHGSRCDGTCGCRCAHLHPRGETPIPVIDGQAALDIWPGPPTFELRHRSRLQANGLPAREVQFIPIAVT
ncbi:hypothetical protein [Nonomuraea candida]|uniref:hypothetical protein n=1 Tax=Nonomuraea candida TaxID=359159 RepID=UPI0005B9C81C|nr:hypothetical protein [Nonomuraea candida]